MNKERAQQLAEQQIRKIQNVQDEAVIEQDLLHLNEQERQKEREKQERMRIERLRMKGVLQNQMEERKDLMKEAHEQYLLEKN